MNTTITITIDWIDADTYVPLVSVENLPAHIPTFRLKQWMALAASAFLDTPGYVLPIRALAGWPGLMKHRPDLAPGGMV